MRRTIQYAIYDDGGEEHYVVSRVDSEVAFPILAYDEMEPEDDFALKYRLEAMPVTAMVDIWDRLTWTRQIPVEVKNVHRKFWGFPPLEVENV